ncbi:MAG: alpha-hydroxy acid oxidase [Gammaproteobacteria bacterium]|jgi:isopentenyl diphosphate isomerase/L-lactate dehydrogenase-like FMN-dependent dehydrogenase|nr:alpha-hydroxy acid oxidase [Gammaproteobacteria bacterium]
MPRRSPPAREALSRRAATTGLLSGTALAVARGATGLLGTAGLAVLPTTARARPELARPASLREVLNIRQLDQLARQQLDDDAYHFIVGAADDGLTKRANREAFERVRIRPRRLIDVTTVDTSVELLGERLASPILLAPAGDHQKLHPDGELAVARAARSAGHLLIAAMLSNYSIAEIAAEGGPTWLQLYPSANRDFMLSLVRAAEAAGCRALVLTIDGPTRGNHEAARWFRMHPEPGATRGPARLGNFSGYQGKKSIGDPAFTWQDVDWLRGQTQLPVVLKGIVTAEDARLCRRQRIDAIVVSNHGGRQEGNGRGTLDVLPEVLAEIDGKLPVLLDGGIRRGADAFRALALGASAVAIGRPYLWGLGAGGEAGVAKCLQILQSELERTMRYAGTPTLAAITAASVWSGNGS